MEYIKAFFILWGTIVGLGTLAGLFKFRKSWDTGIAISGGVTIIYAAMTLLSAFDILMPPIPSWWAWTVAPIGFVILIISQTLSIWAARELKRNFSPTLAPVPEGSLIISGPFQICRHPIMLAMLMSWVGTALALGSISMFITFGFVSIFVMRRVALEEKLLEENYGEAFRTYKQKVSVIVPCLDPTSKEGKDLEGAIDLLKAASWKDLVGICQKQNVEVSPKGNPNR